MSEQPGKPDCICGGTGIVTRLSVHSPSGNTGPEVCDCVAKKAAKEVRERLFAEAAKHKDRTRLRVFIAAALDKEAEGE